MIPGQETRILLKLGPQPIRHVRDGSPLGNGNCEATRSAVEMSFELCIVHARESTEGRKMGGSVGV
jgi:hypothetical protein